MLSFVEYIHMLSCMLQTELERISHKLMPPDEDAEYVDTFRPAAFLGLNQYISLEIRCKAI